MSPSGTLNYLNLKDGAMVEGLIPTYQGPLFSFDHVPLLTVSSLSIGDHFYLFGIDRNMNAIPDVDTLSYDMLLVTVTPNSNNMNNQNGLYPND